MIRRLLFTTMLMPAAMLALPHLAMAQQRLPGVVDRPQGEVELPSPFDLDSEQREPIQPAPEYTKPADADQVVATLTDIRFPEATVIPVETLKAVAAPYLNRPMTKGDLAMLKYELTRAHFEAGYSLVRVVTPPQDLSDGIMEIAIYEAKIGQVLPEGNAVHPHVVKSFASRLESGEVYNEAEAESVTTDLTDLRGVSANATLRPGSEFNTTDIILNTAETKENWHRLAIDNYGSELTGEKVATFDMAYGNLLGWGEEMSFTGRVSDDDLWSVRPGISAPIGLGNVMFNLDYLHSENEIGDRLAALDASGETDALTGSFSSKLINTINRQWEVELGLDARQHESYLAGVTDSEDDVRQGFIGSTYLQRGPYSVVYITGSLVKGIDALGASDEGDPLNSRAMADPEALIFRPLILANYRPQLPVLENGTIRFVASGQVASDALLSSDLFIIGGYGSVRGFDVAQETGDAGFNASLEYAYDLPVTAGDWIFRAGPFYDFGRVYNRVSGAALDDTLHSAGIGIEATGQAAPQLGPLTLRFDWAHPLGDYAATNIDSNWFYFRIAQEF